MGIPGLLQYLKPVIQPACVSVFKGCTVAVDALVWYGLRSETHVTMKRKFTALLILPQGAPGRVHVCQGARSWGKL